MKEFLKKFTFCYKNQNRYNIQNDIFFNEEFDNKIKKLPKSICIIAGGGYLPFEIYNNCIKKDINVIVVGICGEFKNHILQKSSKYNTNQKLLFNNFSYHNSINNDENDYYYAIPENLVISFNAYDIDKIIDHIKSHNIKHVIMVGRVKKSDHLSKLIFSKTGYEILKKITLNGLSDDAILHTITDIIEKNNLIVVSPQTLIDSITTPKGFLTKSIPNIEQIELINKGCNILDAISDYDIGQGLIIAKGGLVLGIEAAEGTQELIHRCKFLIEKFCIFRKKLNLQNKKTKLYNINNNIKLSYNIDINSNYSSKSKFINNNFYKISNYNLISPLSFKYLKNEKINELDLVVENSYTILVKKCKKNQDQRVDLPCIGPDTIISCMESSIAGIALSSKSSIIINYAETIELANKYGIFVYGY
ncbi:LpxI family protein [Lyticum sinuosum]|uniref:LpxI family protein n=1 Tax=Lyticum sinuosum TaxID=1332059 RepID=A0AAE4VJJ9_9RICK|nr:UDP-2,3-diacylglucosamine diphosphatase LpxI [Lyticum sinuosum]MDZ5761001.1 LpxI family protein [Lyticum sinuosum]